MSAVLSATATFGETAALLERDAANVNGVDDLDSAKPFRGIALGVFLSVPIWILIGWTVHAVV